MPEATPIVSNPEPERLENALALCLSGGGYRAMLFHLGVLRYFNDTALLGKLDRIAGVSGGSLTAGVLGMQWSALMFDAPGRATNFRRPHHGQRAEDGATTVDTGAVILGTPLPGTIGDRVITSAFPPILSPARLSFKPGDFSLNVGACNTPQFTSKILLTDGGVYDNMGIETA
ncbi:MAG: patatin-like phospholipase family protein [Thermoanaerobaculia bacterium]